MERIVWIVQKITNVWNAKMDILWMKPNHAKKFVIYNHVKCVKMLDNMEDSVVFVSKDIN